MNVVEVETGTGPIILGQPHGGVNVPDEIFARLNQRGQGLADTDWHIHRLYDGLLPGLTVVQSNIHRYVIDTNRDPKGASLYPGQNTTDLCPVSDFDGQQIWCVGQEPGTDEISARTEAYHHPYHCALAEQIERVLSIHGQVIFYDCHSIRSRIPFLFAGELPVFSIGTNESVTCDQSVERSLLRTCEESMVGKTVVNGRFKGGWSTRTYGRPGQGVHAIQMELAQRAYMNENPAWRYLPERAEKLRSVLRQGLAALEELVQEGTIDGR